MITRRPAQRIDAREFQQAKYFDNILVSTIRFLDSLPAKTPNEKQQFLRGLPKILIQFPKSVLEKKVLPALLDETKDRELLALVLQNVFKIITMLPSGKRAFTEKVIPKLRETFLSGTAPSSKGTTPDRDSLKEAGLMVLLENMSIAADNSSGKDFKDGKLLDRTPLRSFQTAFFSLDTMRCYDLLKLSQAKILRYPSYHQLCARISYTLPSRRSPSYTSGYHPGSRFLNNQE